MSSLALYAAPIEKDNDNNKNGNNIIENKRVNRWHNKTIKNKGKVENMKKELAFSSMDSDSADMGDFKPIEEVDHTSPNNEVSDSFAAHAKSQNADYNTESFQNNPNLASEEYYKEIVPNYINNNSNPELSQKLDYLIHLLEEQREQKTGSVTEEIILYSFLGVFIIFVLDSFARAGKYTR